MALGRPVFVAPGRIGDWATAGALTLLRDTPARLIVGLDVLVAETGLSPGAISTAVTLLLMRGWVRSVGPAYIVAGPLSR